MSPHHVANAAGLRFELLSHGAPRRILAPGVMLNLFLGNELEGSLGQLWLEADGERLALLGPASPLESRWADDGFERCGHWRGLQLRLCLQLLPDRLAWAWRLAVTNGGAPCRLRLLLTQDLGLADYGAIRLNEFYVSQYLDFEPLQDGAHGWVMAVRQNQAQGGRHPQLLAGAFGRAEAFATDALQVWGLRGRESGLPPAPAAELPSTRLQHEHALLALREAPVELAPGASAELGFWFALDPDHPAASGPQDLAGLAALRAQWGALPPALPGPAEASAASLFARAPQLATRELSLPELDEAFGRERRHEERAGATLLSFFHGRDAHVVTRAKELAVQRPHGHLLRAGHHLTPDESAVTVTCWMAGGFASMLTQGHVSFNRLLSTQRTWLGLFRANGLRLFAEIGGEWQLLGLPSAFEMRPQACRWLYAHAGGLLEVSASCDAAPDRMRLAWRVRSGPPLRLRASLQLALAGDDGADPHPPQIEAAGEALLVTPPAGSEMAARFPGGGLRLEASLPITAWGRDGLFYANGRDRGEPLLGLELAPAAAGSLSLASSLLPAAAPQPERLALPRAGGAGSERLAPLLDMLPWFQHNALVHYLSPRGLEQYSGGGWGTRDVCQGPVEMLLALGQTAPVRDLLLRSFAAQNPDGDWPQWFMFFPRDAAIRAGDSHGDIVFWPLHALAQYLIASGDTAILHEPLPFHGAAPEPLRAHVEQALALIQRRVVPGTRLTAYWHGDWNDSLQPADPALRERLASSWTVTLHHQTLTALARALSQAGETLLAARCRSEAEAVLAAFQALLVRDEVVCGYGYFPEGGPVEPWIHPRDTRTGLRYSLLPMMHAVLAEMLTPAQAQQQARLIEAELLGPDGARLFDAPIPYAGGVSRRFQRAETASFFGREVGIMYMHAHLRWCQMLAHLGQAEAFWRALLQAVPIGLPERVPGSSRRQANCYYSSSDAAFPDRYVATARYGDIAAGRVALDGGWRVYSSGPGIALGLVIGHLLGIRLEQGHVLVDPVLPRELDGLTVELRLGEIDFRLRYTLGPQGHGVQRILQDGHELRFERRAHAYRVGAAALPRPVEGQRVDWQIFTG